MYYNITILLTGHYYYYYWKLLREIIDVINARIDEFADIFIDLSRARVHIYIYT